MAELRTGLYSPKAIEDLLRRLSRVTIPRMKRCIGPAHVPDGGLHNELTYAPIPIHKGVPIIIGGNGHTKTLLTLTECGDMIL
jgi:hypothetical protein